MKQIGELGIMILFTNSSIFFIFRDETILHNCLEVIALKQIKIEITHTL